MFLIIGKLQTTAAFGFVDCLLHRLSNLVGIHYNFAIKVTSSATGSLSQRPVRTKESLFVGIENCHKRHFRQVEAFTKQVNAYEHINGTCAKVIENLYAVHGVDIGVNISHTHIVVGKIFRQFFSHSLGECSDQSALVAFHAGLYLID